MRDFVKRWLLHWRSSLKKRATSLDSQNRFLIDVKAKRLLEDNISSGIATWDSLREGAVLREHFRDVARGRKEP